MLHTGADGGNRGGNEGGGADGGDEGGGANGGNEGGGIDGGNEGGGGDGGSDGGGADGGNEGGGCDGGDEGGGIDGGMLGGSSSGIGMLTFVPRLAWEVSVSHCPSPTLPSINTSAAMSPLVGWVNVTLATRADAAVAEADPTADVPAEAGHSAPIQNVPSLALRPSQTPEPKMALPAPDAHWSLGVQPWTQQLDDDAPSKAIDGVTSAPDAS